MLQQEIEACLQEICHWQLERNHEMGFDDDPDYQIELRPPATARQIADCEEYLGRPFPPSYRHFLSLHNGLKLGYEWFLMGTDDYMSETVKAHLTWFNRDFLNLDVRNPFPDIPDEVFSPQHFYRLVDTREEVPAHLSELKAFIDSYQERNLGGGPYTADDFDVCLPRNLMLSFEEGNDCYKFFNYDTLRPDGEMDIASLCCDEVGHSADENVYELLKKWMD